MLTTKARQDLFQRFASKEITKLTLSQFYTAGRHLLKHRKNGTDGFTAFQLTANFLYRELPVRIGQTINGLEQNPSPYKISKVPQLRTLLERYTDDLTLLVSQTPAPSTPDNNTQFVNALRRLKGRYREHMWTMAQGLRELSAAIRDENPDIVPKFLRPSAARRRRMGGKAPHHLSSTLAYPDLSAPMAYLAPSGKMVMTDPAAWSASGEPAQPQQWAANRVCSEFCNEPQCHNPRLWDGDSTRRCAENQTRRLFDWVYSMSLGTQLLIEDHVSIHDHGRNLVQIIQPLEIATRAAHDASITCQRHYGFAPPVVRVIAPHPTITTTYVPHHLYSLLFELLKNALRATVETHRGSKFPPVKLIMASGDEDVAFKVSDEGGGIPLSQVDAIWSYLGTTERPVEPSTRSKTDTMSSISFMKHAADMPLFGAGHSLPMARQLARYFGGDLDLVSMEGVGTDFYLHLSRSKNVVEHMPDITDFMSTMASDSLASSSPTV
ncbi:[Pyruvate dehydrogenase (acetyl-transferring)] kinase isozyme 2 [Linderina pennispora]|nr:[Pyruvate dehydrogenase (acetyl-transferring)] kinase isozyme 2 [Linderina pennispora]